MIVAACGLVCSDCEAYKATQAGDAQEIAKIARQWTEEYKIEFKPEQVWCDGCMTTDERKNDYAGKCPIRACVIDHKLEHCAQCVDYACEVLSKFHQMVPDAKKALDELYGASTE
ncbi:MAG TPA: DUF3795 domain-containing protein [Armatimonadota bacterium]|jgi:hypothetical protein|nr:DUF3795 domain-containing protein [Armatimonadota bacterium]